jgi:hypothetical protein
MVASSRHASAGWHPTSSFIALKEKRDPSIRWDDDVVLEFIA